ncbi:MAG: ATP-binding cassette domain-containing protein [Bacteroidota bacterium]
MSEEILRALMQLFAIITKQDGGVSSKEQDYVLEFLQRQIGSDAAGEYFNYFLEYTKDEKETAKGSSRKLTSVLDSVRILKICKQINKTLDQRQKVVVAVRLLELINTGNEMTEQRLGIIETVTEVFRISSEEYRSILDFVTAGPEAEPNNPLILSIRDQEVKPENNLILHASGLDKPVFVLRVPSVELYFLRYTGFQELFLNGLSLQKEIIYLLASGSSLRLTKGAPIYYSDITSLFQSGGDMERITLEAGKISYLFPGGEQGLSEISFAAEQGNLVGIMGSSGSGKTTLLNILAGIYRPASGKLTINGMAIDDPRLKGVTGFVPQDDLLIEELTVYENLYFNARFCFRDKDRDSLRSLVDRTLASLGLYEKRDLKVGSVMNKTISGGQRKRLNIALELIREPSVLFLDEPTSGLSSRDSENVMDLLRELTLRGKLIFVVIHQPSSDLYKMFDRVIILDTGGQMVYYGNPVDAVSHFREIDHQVNAGVGECPVCGNINPETIFNIIESQQVDEFGNYTGVRKIKPATFARLYKKMVMPPKVTTARKTPVANLKIPGWAGQFFNYFRRDLRSKTGNRQYLLLTLLEAPILGLILSYIIRYIADPSSKTYIFRENENIPVYIFMSLIVALFLGLIVSAEEIFRDRKILKREQFLHLSRSAYLFAKISILTLISGLQALTFVLIANTVLGIRDMYFIYWFALFTTAVCANLIGLNISSTFNSAVTIYITVPLVMIPMMVLSGAMFSFEKLNRSITSVDKVPLIAEMMPTKWSYEALMVHQFKDNRFRKYFFDFDKEISYNSFRSSYYIPALQDRLTACREEYEETGKISRSVRDLTVLKNELTARSDLPGDLIPDGNELTPDGISAAALEKAGMAISALGEIYIRKYSEVNQERERFLRKVMEEKRGQYYSMLDRYDNESVGDQVKKIYEKNKIVEENGRLWQQIDPIYLDPLPQNPVGIRSHFFAPRKMLFGHYFDTYWFNLSFIWFMSLLYYILLYFDGLKHAAQFLDRLRRKTIPSP